MVIIVLAALWAVVLVPPALRSQAERKRNRSMDGYSRRLSVLALPAEDRMAPAGEDHEAVVALAPPRSSRQKVAEVVPLPAPFHVPPAPFQVPAAPRPRLGRAEVLRRRRRTLFVLAVVVAVTFVAGLFPPLRLAWALHVTADVAAAAYLFGLRRLRRLAIERRAKVRHLPKPAPAVALPVEWTEDSPTIEMRRFAGSR